MTSAYARPHVEVRSHGSAHVTPAAAGGWLLWRTLECRTAGFPAMLVLGLASEHCASAADALAEARAKVRALFDERRADLKRRIRAELAAITPTALVQHTLLALRLAVKALDRRNLDHASLIIVEPGVIDALREALYGMKELEQAFADGFNQSSMAIAARLRELALEPGLREAVTWQNKPLVPNVFDRLAASAPGDENHRHEELVASYLQRYCVKNDTIGFFGPVGWARWDDALQGVDVGDGGQHLATRTVYFEDWAVQALADRLSADRRLRPWMVPTLAPYLRVVGEQLMLPGGAVTRITRGQAALIAASRSGSTAGRIAEALLQNPFSEYDDEEEIFDALSALAAARWLHFGFAVRLGDARPEARLRSELEAVDDSELREEALAPLRALEAARANVAAAAGAPHALRDALFRLDTTFEAVTGSQSGRNAGETYGARTVVYEDCRRATEVRFGADLRGRLQKPLSLVLASARWFCHGAARVFRESLAEVFERLVPEAAVDAERSIDMPTFWMHAQELFYGEGPAGIAALQERLAFQWRELLCAHADGDGEDIRHESAALATAVDAAFSVPDPGWAGAMHQSPDVLIAARDTAAIALGDVLFVLGEVHVGINTLINHSALEQHPDAQELLDALHADLGAPRVMPRISRVGTGQPIRVQTVADTRCDVELKFSLGALPLRSDASIDLAALQVRSGKSGLQAVTENGALSFDLLDVFAQLLSGFIADRFRLLPHQRRCPRISIDQLVVQRRSWRIPADELAFLAGLDRSEVFLELRRWASSQGLPRWCFVKLPWEKKPHYLDLASPLYVRMLAKQVRNALRRDADRGSCVVFSEMLPSHDELWMPSGTDLVCTSELRLVAVHQDDCRAVHI